LFRCTDSFGRKFLKKAMGWSPRKSTRAVQKVPSNAEEICYKHAVRYSMVIRDHNIPAALNINSDQTQILLQHSTQMTWTKAGSKQVGIVGSKERQAFTLMVSVTISGLLLPFQSIWHGKTSLSLPPSKSKDYVAANLAGFLWEPSNSHTYWSTHETMHSFMHNILAPYFEKTKETLGLPASQHSVWQIDIWSVHRLEEFRQWMRKNHPTITILYIPANCTGL
ncbi:hypothetical protein JB92DRAFT_2622660, partial [Gautieria morchelliformis]